MWSRANGTYDYSVHLANPAVGGAADKPTDLTAYNVAVQAKSMNKDAMQRKEHIKRLAARDRAAHEAHASAIKAREKLNSRSDYRVRAPWDYDDNDREEDLKKTEEEALRRVREVREKEKENARAECGYVKSTKLYSKNKEPSGDEGAINEGFKAMLRGDTPSEEGQMEF
jgi:hypothetical protein